MSTKTERDTPELKTKRAVFKLDFSAIVIDQLSLTLMPLRVAEVLELIPADIGHVSGYTLN